jgi:hypothetical protein
MSVFVHQTGSQRVRLALIALVAASALAAVLPTSAAAAPNHQVPTIKCSVLFGQNWITVPLPTYVQGPYQGEKVTLRFYLFKRNQYGGWDFKQNGQYAYTNYATSGGALTDLWHPNGNWLVTSISDTFYPTERGVYAVAMYIAWGEPLRPRDSAYEWAYNTCSF